MEYFLVADQIESEKSFELESPKIGSGTSIYFADTDDAVVLRGMGIGTEIDVVVDGGVFDAGMEELILSVYIHGKIGGCMEVVFPAEVVGIILGFEPGGRFAFQVDTEV